MQEDFAAFGSGKDPKVLWWFVYKGFQGVVKSGGEDYIAVVVLRIGCKNRYCVGMRELLERFEMQDEVYFVHAIVTTDGYAFSYAKELFYIDAVHFEICEDACSFYHGCNWDDFIRTVVHVCPIL